MEIEEWAVSSSNEILSDRDEGNTLINKNLEVDLNCKTSQDTLSVLQDFEINHVDIHIGRPVGTGAFSAVYEAKWLGCTFVVKRFELRSPISIQKELYMLIQLCHPRIVQLMGWYVDSDRRYSIVMEFMNGNLRELIKSRMAKSNGVAKIGCSNLPRDVRPFEDHEALDIITKIAWGMAFLHFREVMHGDLKSLNVLVRYVDCCMDVKLVGFGESQIIADHCEVHDELGVKPNRQSNFYGGSGFWRAPEILRRLQAQNSKNTVEFEALDEKSVDLKALDVYSFAMTCYEVLTGNVPFEDEEFRATEYAPVISGTRPKLPADLNSSLKKLIKSCWHDEPHERPSFENICSQLDAMRSGNQLTRVFHNIFENFSWRGKGDVGGTNIICEDSPRVPVNLRIDFSTIKIVRLIGSGSSSEMYEATWLGSTFAVKKFSPFGYFRGFHQEVEFMFRLRHPHIVQLVGFSMSPPLIVSEFMGRNLRNLIDSRIKERSSGATKIEVTVPFDMHEAVSIINQIALGMAFLHSRGLVHRDLKSFNVLVQEHTGHIDVKIGDFGASLLHDSLRRSGAIARDYVAGTSIWMAPEILSFMDNPKLTPDLDRYLNVDLMAADVYSFAITCFEILTGEIPFYNQPGGPRFRKLILSGQRPRLPSYLHPRLRELIELCWCRDPMARPVFTEICEVMKSI